MTKILPYPLLSISIVVMWCLLSGLTLGQFLIGLIVGLAVGPIMALLNPEKVKVKRWSAVILLFFRVFMDVATSNIAVAKVILSRKPNKRKSGFILIPLELTNRTGLAVLSCILTATPGTAWVAYHSKHSVLMLHILDLEDGDDWRNLIKSRYEKPLLEIFQ